MFIKHFLKTDLQEDPPFSTGGGEDNFQMQIISYSIVRQSNIKLDLIEE